MNPATRAVGVALIAALQVAAPASGDDALTAFEARLRAAPDDLVLGADYRQAALRVGACDRAVAFYEALAAAHPDLANTQLNLGYAYVDKVPEAGPIKRVFLANASLEAFSRSIAIRPSWLALYTRGNGYLYWPRLFGRAADAVDDLQAAMRLQPEPAPAYHARTYVALGDAYAMQGDLVQARRTWTEGAARFADQRDLAARLSASEDALEAIFDATYDVDRRSDTSLLEMYPRPLERAP